MEQFYKTVYGDEIPVVETVVVKGRATISPFGVKLPARFIFVHNAGKDYRHYIEATWFGMPILKVNEGYLDRKSFFESPMGNIYDDASTNQGANLAVWAEAGWFPSIWLTDPRVRWESVDEKTALLFVPFEDRKKTSSCASIQKQVCSTRWKPCGSENSTAGKENIVDHQEY